LFGLLLLYFAGVMVESLGLGMMLPVFQFMQSGGNVSALVESSRIWEHLVSLYSFLGLDVSLLTLLSTSMLLFILRQCFAYARTCIMAASRQELVRNLQDEMFEKFLMTSLSYHDTHPTGRFIDDIVQQVSRSTKSAFTSINLIGQVLICAVYLVILAVLSLSMTGLALISFVCAGLLITKPMKKSRQVSRLVVKVQQDLTNFLVEKVKSLRLIRLSSAEEKERTSFRFLTEDQRAQLMKTEKLRALVEVSVEPVVVAAGFFLLFSGYRWFSLSLEEIGLFILIVLRLLPILKGILSCRQTILSNYGSIEAVQLRIKELDEAREDYVPGKAFNKLDKGIHFDNVTFHYPGRDRFPALKNVNLFIPANSMTAIVGPSGAGKSTLIDLIPRLRMPQSGRIFIDEVPLEDYDVMQLRRKTAYAQQMPQMFNVTIKDYIKYGNPDIDDQQVQSAAKLAGVMSFVENLQLGMDTEIGEAGATLSGGQRQRLELARILAGDVLLVILDEPTSNLDADAEALFLEEVKRIREETDLTIIVIAHRLTTITMADNIVVFNNGEIDSSGTHDELMLQDGWYASAYNKQLQAYEK